MTSRAVGTITHSVSAVTRVLQADDPEWDAWLDRTPHDIYHRAAYHQLAEQSGEGKAQMIVHGNVEKFVAWPYMTSRITGNYTDASSVYGYTGPIGSGLADNSFLLHAWTAMRAVWSEQQLVALFTRFHPVLKNYRYCNSLQGSGCPSGGELYRPGRSVSISLLPDHDERRRSYRKALRQEIQSAERSGLVVELDNDWSHFKTFAHFYRLTMEKNRASDRYLFTDEYFSSLRNALGDNGHLAVASVEGEAAAIMLFTVCGEIAQAHLTGVNPEFNAMSPLKCLIDGTAGFAKTFGAKLLHLGAGRGGFEDSLFTFKSRFSPVRHDFILGRWILDSEKYDSLTTMHNSNKNNTNTFNPVGGTHSKTGDDPDNDKKDFFPAYRRPVVQETAIP
ncbi:MAG: GNAT family N-acetyltransferase [Granulosicoccus sp.]